MKTRVFGVNILKFAGVTVLLSSLWLLATLRSPGKQGHQAGARPAPITAKEESRLARAKEDQRWIEAYGKLPLSFEENVGQSAHEVRYISHGSRYELSLTPQEAVLALRSPVHLDLSPRNLFATLRALRDARRARQATMTAVLRMQLEGANPKPQMVGTDLLPGKVNYFIGNDPKKWHTDVPAYARVKYVGIYPGVDLVFYGNQRRLEYDFVVAPGADPKSISLRVDGARKMRIDPRGDLLLTVPGGEVELQRPVIYQQMKGQRREIEGKYIITRDRRVRFSVATYDRSEPLVLDPVLNYSTYLGGESDDVGTGIAVDSNGNAFIAGTTFSTRFPTTSNAFKPGPLASNVGGAFATFISEINPSGTQLLYSTYLAGSVPGEFAFGIAVDPSDKIYVTGFTLSTDFPTSSTDLSFVPGFKLSPNTGNVNGTSFIAKFDPTQTTGVKSFLYSSYIGGTNGSIGELGHSVAVADSSGVVYVAGFTDSTAGTGQANFPIVNGFQTARSTVNGNAFLTKIDTTTSAAPVYSTYLGANDANFAAARLGFGDAAFGLAVDSSSNAYLVGQTTSTDFATFATVNPTLKGFDLTYPAGNVTNTAFVSRIDTTKTAGASLAYLTYLGGAGPDFGNAIAVGPAPNNLAYVTGQTNSSSFPIFPVAVPPAGPYQTTKGASGVAFVSLIDTTTSANPSYSTFLGGNGGDEGLGIRVDGQGNAYVAGKTQSTDFPHSEGAFQPAMAAGASGNGFVSKLNPAGQGAKDLVYSSYFGGGGDTRASDIDQAEAIAIDSSNNVYISGHTFSTATSFPIFPPATATTPAFQTALNGKSDAFVAKLALIPTLAVSPTSLNFGVQPVGVASAPNTVTLTNNTSDPIPFPGSSVTFSGTNAADFSSPPSTCGASIAAGASCTVGAVFTPSVAAGESATLVITVVITNGGVSGSQSFNVSLSGTGSASAPGVGLAPTSLSFGGQMLTTTSVAKTVTLTNNGNAALTINSIAASGDFAQTNTCPVSPATLPPAGTCTISVTFAPTAVAARTGTLTITDNAGGSPHKVPLTGAGWDFTVTAPSAATVKAGQSVNFAVTMTPLGGFTQAVTVACSGAPALATCTPAPASIAAADGVTSQTSTVTVTTVALMVPPLSRPVPPLSIQRVVPLVVAGILLLLLLSARRLRMRLGLATAMLIFAISAGCSGSKAPGTPKGTTNLTITCASTGSAGTVTKQPPLTVALTVN